MITVNSTRLPTPASMSINLYDITQAERNSKGTMFIDLIAKKWKIELDWSYLTQQDLQLILNALETSIVFPVTCINPQTGLHHTIQCYKGDRVMPVLQYSDDMPTWKDFKISLIEV